MSKLVKVDNKYVEQLRDEVAELGGNGFGTLLKFDWETKQYMVGKDEISLGRKFIAHCDQYARGWVKFVDKVVVDVRVKKVGEGKPPERDELDEPMLADTPDDPWVFQRYLPLEDPETGEVLGFVSKSVGGKMALADLLGVFERNYDRGRSSKCDGDIEAIVGWTGDGQNVVTQKEPGPPETDPDDPGYLLDDFR